MNIFLQWTAVEEKEIDADLNEVSSNHSDLSIVENKLDINSFSDVDENNIPYPTLEESQVKQYRNVSTQLFNRKYFFLIWAFAFCI